MRINLGQIAGMGDEGDSGNSGDITLQDVQNAASAGDYVQNGNIYYPTGATPAPAAATNWGSIISSIFSPITKLAQTRYGVPQLAAGQSITQGPGGTYQYTQNGPGVSASGASLTGTAGLSGSMPLLIGGVVLLALFMGGKK